MTDGGPGRLLVASLHQGIADMLPNRLEFYETWLNPPGGLRDGRIGHAPMTAVLSFLRQEGEPYRLVSARAGEYTADWTIAALPAVQRRVIRSAPAAVGLRLAMVVGRRMVRGTFAESRASSRFTRGTGAIDLHDSVFCNVRERTPEPLCEFYASAFRTLLRHFGLHADVGTDRCRATGSDQCVMSVRLRAPEPRS